MYSKKKRGNLKPDNSTLLLNLKPMLAARNILHPSAFLIKIGISRATATKILKDKSVSVSHKHMSALCQNLNCEPSNLYVVRDMQLPEGHALHALKTVEEVAELVSINEWLKNKSVQELKELMKAG